MADEATGVQESLVTFTLDGKEMTAHPGELIIAAAERAGNYIPRFCYHPRMKPVGVCRMCLVEVVGPRGGTLTPSCFMSVTEGMEVITNSEKVKKAQDGVLELLLANHPLDCPVCDKGGECPLQDQTLAYGPGESRFVEEKRHFEKPIAISELVLLDRERCIQCSRCTRFADEVAGEALIDFAGRGERVEVATFPGEPFSSYFSGNTVQICPVGALTAQPYRFSARPWDLDQVESTCTTCAMGCRVAVQSSGNRLTRLLGLDSEPVNHGWLCDKGRFVFEAVNGDHCDDAFARITEPMVRRGGVLEPTTWSDALATASVGITQAMKATGPESVAFIGGAQLTNEGAYAWTKLAKGVIGTDSVDAQLGDGLSAELIFSLPPATIDEAATARTIIVLAGDLREELPVLFLRLRDAATNRGARILEISSVGSSLTSLAAASVRVTPGCYAAGVEALFEKRSTPQSILAEHEGGEGVVIVVGRPSLAESDEQVASAIVDLADRLPKATFLVALRRANIRGALEMGMSPGLLPGRVSLEAGRDWFSAKWGGVAATRGRSSAATLAALANGEGVGALVLLGADPIADFPDSALARRALDNSTFTVCVAGHHSEATRSADVVLPAAVAHERSGTTTNIEGRISRVIQKLVPPAQVWSDVAIAVELAVELGSELDLDETSVFDEIEQVVVSYAGITRSLLASRDAGDGVLGTHAPVPPAPLDPMAFPGLSAPERIGAGAFAGTVSTEVAHRASSEAVERPPVGAGVVRPIARHKAPRAGILLLVADRVLYDEGAAVLASPSVATLVEHARVRMHSQALSKVGARSGDRVIVSSERSSIEVAALKDDDVDPRAVVIHVNTSTIDGATQAAGRLIDSSLPNTPVRVEVAK